MTEISPSAKAPSAVLTTPERTLADLIALVTDDAELSATRRRDLVSALRCFCRVLALQPRDAPASHAFLRKRLEGFHPVQAARAKQDHPRQHGLSEKTFQNMRAGVGAVLQRYVLPGRRVRADRLPPDWEALWQALGVGHQRAAFSRLFRYCVERGLVPAQVDDAVIADFAAWLERETFVVHQRQMLKSTVRQWNTAADTIPGWPRVRLTLPSSGKAYVQPWEDLPEALRRDIEAWLAQNRDPDPLDDAGPARPLRPATLRNHRMIVRQVAAALLRSGVPASDLTGLADLVRPERARLALRFFLARHGNAPSPQTGNIANVMISIARHWATLPEADLAELRRLRAKVTPQLRGMRAKNRERLRQFDGDRNKALLLGLAEAVFAEKRRLSAPSRADALEAQAALAVEILLMLPLRMQNLHRLHLDDHMRRQRDHGRSRLFVVIPEAEVKNGEPVEAELPAGCAALLDAYLERYRPLLADAGNRWLFPSLRTGRHKSPEALTDLIQRLVFGRTGLTVNPHLFRHITAKLYLDANPGGYEVMRRVLGHRSMDTTANSYAGQETAAAGRHFNATILKLRQGDRHD